MRIFLSLLDSEDGAKSDAFHSENIRNLVSKTCLMALNLLFIMFLTAFWGPEKRNPLPECGLSIMVI